MMEFKVTFKLLLVFAVVSAVIGQNWTTFQKKHVLDPTVDSGYAEWDRGRWNTWLSRRLRNDYGSKGVNSVIVQAPATILTRFGFLNPGNGVYHWSSTRLPTYVLKLVNRLRTYDVYRCPPLFVLARLDPEARPLHYHGNALTQIANGQVPLNLGRCVRVN